LAGDVGAGEPGQVGTCGRTLGRAQRTVHADDQRVGTVRSSARTLHVCPDRVPAAEVDDGDGDPEGQLGRDLAGGRDRRLGVRVSKIVSISNSVDGLLGQRPICSAYAALTWSNVTADSGSSPARTRKGHGSAG